MVRLYYENISYRELLRDMPGMSPESYLQIIDRSDKMVELKTYYEIIERIKREPEVPIYLPSITLIGTFYYFIDNDNTEVIDYYKLMPERETDRYGNVYEYIHRSGSMKLAEDIYDVNGVSLTVIKVDLISYPEFGLADLEALLKMDDVVDVKINAYHIELDRFLIPEYHDRYIDLLNDESSIMYIKYKELEPYSLGG